MPGKKNLCILFHKVTYRNDKISAGITRHFGKLISQLLE